MNSEKLYRRRLPKFEVYCKMADPLAFVAWLLANRDERAFREHGDAFELSDSRFVAEYRLSKDAVRWICDRSIQCVKQCRRCLWNERCVRCDSTLLVGSKARLQATSLAIDQSTVSGVLTEVTDAILLHLLPWIRFPQNAEKKAIVEKCFRASGMSGIIGKLQIIVQ